MGFGLDEIKIHLRFDAHRPYRPQSSSSRRPKMTSSLKFFPGPLQHKNIFFPVLLLLVGLRRRWTTHNSLSVGRLSLFSGSLPERNDYLHPLPCPPRTESPALASLLPVGNDIEVVRSGMLGAPPRIVILRCRRRVHWAPATAAAVNYCRVWKLGDNVENVRIAAGVGHIPRRVYSTTSGVICRR